MLKIDSVREKLSYVELTHELRYSVTTMTATSNHHTSFVSKTERATSSLSFVSCVRLRPSFSVPVSISNILDWNLLRAEDRYVRPWLVTDLWMHAGWCADDLKTQDE